MNLYLLAILPPPDLSSQIDEIRKECAQKFDVKAALKPPVHITLYRLFKEDDRNEGRLIKYLKHACHSLFPFEQDIENFDTFHTHVVYLRALKNPGIHSVYKSISDIFRKHKIAPLEDGSKNMAFNPHLTIAYRDIPPDTFPLIWEEYKSRKFKRSFNVNEFSLLKHDRQKWNVIENFRLQGTRQATLFD